MADSILIRLNLFLCPLYYLLMRAVCDRRLSATRVKVLAADDTVGVLP